jgi:hypothetical protein
MCLPTDLRRRDVRIWPINEVATPHMEVRSVRHCGLDLLTLSFSRFDPKRTLKGQRQAGLLLCLEP